MTANIAIRFELDGYVTTGATLMGRQAAGAGFLRAATKGLRGLPLTCYSPRRSSFVAFVDLIQRLDPSADTQWIPADRLDQLANMGTVYLPDPSLGEASRHRLRMRPLAYSIMGVLHTTASHGAMDMIADLMTAPAMPWDALICPSSAVASTVHSVLAHEHDYLEHRLGTKLPAPSLQLPIIPLGVHCEDFVFSPEERRAARNGLGISTNAVVVLFVGRLSFHAKAHPHALYVALEEIARANASNIVLLQCGWFASAGIADAFIKGAATLAPSVRTLFSDGRNATSLRQSWAAANIFVSLSDNVQETFGLTPIEAMASGLPVVVSDWDGYKDTVRDGIDGFRIPTWMPPEGVGGRLAARHELAMETYDRYCGLSAQNVVIDGSALRNALTLLINDSRLRTSLGASGQERAQERYDWSVVFGAYQQLADELGARRAAGLTKHADAHLTSIRNSPRRMDPYQAFKGYATRHISADTCVVRMSHATTDYFVKLRSTSLWIHTADGLPDEPIVAEILSEPISSITDISARTGLSIGQTIAAVAPLAKMGLVSLAAGSFA